MIIEVPDDNSIVRWKKNDKDEWKSAEISDLIKVYERQLIKAYKGRLKGEWVYDTDHSITIDMYKCSICGCDGHTHFNFCPKCGADMNRKENKDGNQ